MASLSTASLIFGQSATDGMFNSRILVQYSAQLWNLRTKPTWKKVLAQEEMAKKIQDIVQEMDQLLAAFQV